MERKSKLTAEEEGELIVRAQAGDAGAHSELLDRFSPMLWKFARARHSIALQPEDLYQESYIFFLRAIRNFRPAAKCRLITYCYRTIPRQLSNLIDEIGPVVRSSRDKSLPNAKSKQAAEIARQYPESLHDNMAVDQSSPVFAAMLLQEKRDAVRNAIASLPDRWREILEMRMDGVTLKDAGNKLGFCHERIRQIETRAMRHLAEVLTTQENHRN